MIAGATTTRIGFSLGGPFGSRIGLGLLAADVDGTTQPDATAAIPIIGIQDDNQSGDAEFDGVNIFELVPNYSIPATSTLTHKLTLSTATFDTTRPCIDFCLPQPTVAQELDFLGIDRPLHRLAYRNFGTYESMVMNWNVGAKATVAGVRWTEIRRTGISYSIYQQGTYSPDNTHRWMGSIAQDKFGNIALGYSVTSASVFPGIRYTGRVPTDPLGIMSVPETVLKNGFGSQSGSELWSLHSSMNVDPTDDCTFWYVNQYYATTSDDGWQTRISSLRLPGC
jgi:hypothetical protein